MVDRILVTGASGLLGREVVEQAVVNGSDVCSVYFEHKPDIGRSLRLDLTNAKSVKECLQAERPDFVINTASLTDVDRCEREPELAKIVNGDAAGFLAEACRDVDAFLVHVSTDYVFDGRRGNYNENDQPAPINQYGASKLLGEQLVKKYENTCVGRTSVVFGWGRLPRLNFGAWVYSKLSKGEKVSVISDQFASPTLNTNLAAMVLELAKRRIRGLVHVAGATKCSRYDFAVKLANALQLQPDIVTPIKSQASSWIAKRPNDSSLNVRRAMESLITKPLKIDEAMRKFVESAQTT
jgi:dTDP-4-dehydrorhamnose reductase